MAGFVDTLVKCELCESDLEVLWFCVDCSQRLCTICKSHHLRNKKSKNDRIISIEDVNTDDGVSSQNDENTCVLHEGKVRDFFCHECEDVICSDCLSESHRKHEWFTKEQSLKTFKSILSDLVQKFNDKLLKYRDIAEKDETMHTFFLKRLSNCKTDITEMAELICEETTQLKDEYLQEIATLEDMEIKRYSGKRERYGQDVQEMNTAITDIEKEIRSCNLFDLLVISKEMKRKELNIPTPEEHRVIPPSFDKTPFQKTKLVSMFGMLKRPESMKTIEELGVSLKVTHLQTNLNRKIIAICPLNDGSTWLSYNGGQEETDNQKRDRSRRLILIDENLREIAKSCQFDREVVNMALFQSNYILLTCFMDTCVYKLSSDGQTVTTFADLDPNYARSVCVQNDNEVIACGNSPRSSGIIEKSKNVILRLSTTGNVLQEIQLDDHDPEVLQLPYRVTSCPTGEIIVVDRASRDHRIVCVDKKGRYLYTWRGEGIGEIDPLDVTAVSHKHICLVVDECNNKIYALSRYGRNACVLLDKRKRDLGPRCIATDKRGRIWVGCNRGTIILGEIHTPLSRSGSNRSGHFSV